MARIAGVDLPLGKRIQVGLTYIYGIGKSRATKICEEAGINLSTEVKDLTEDEAVRIRNIIQRAGMVEGDLRKAIPSDYITQGIMWANLLAPYVGGKQFTTTGVNLSDDLTRYFRSYKFFQCPAVRSPTNNVKPLHYIVNTLDMPKNMADWQSYTEVKDYHRLSTVPRPVGVVYITEINEDKAKIGQMSDYANMNIFRPSTTTFNQNGNANPPTGIGTDGARMMHANERRHGGSVDMTFFDTHVESRKLRKEAVPYWLFSPGMPH